MSEAVVSPVVAPGRARSHSRLGASGMARWLACPGSYELTRRNEHVLAHASRASRHAARGTVAHALIETALLELGPELCQDTVVQCDGHSVTIDDEMLDGVELMLDYVSRVRDDYEEMLVEHPVVLDAYFPLDAPVPEPLYTYVDVLLVGPRRIEVIDYKNGAGVRVGVEDNPQLLYGAAGALLALGDPHTAENIRLTVVQPNAPGGERIRHWDLTALDVVVWVDEVLRPGVYRVSQPDAPLNMGPHCQFCAAASVCPALRAAAQEAARRDFEPVPDDMPPRAADLAEELALAEMAELWIAALRERAEHYLREGRKIPGWGLIPKRAVRRWIDESMVLPALTAASNEDVSQQLVEHRLVSPAQAEKLLSPGLREVFHSLVERVSSGDKLGRVNETWERL